LSHAGVLRRLEVFRTYGAPEYLCCVTQPLRAGLTCAAPPALRNPVEELVPRSCERQKPGAAVVEAEGGAGEGDLRERVFVGARILHVAILHAAGVIVAAMQN